MAGLALLLAGCASGPLRFAEVPQLLCKHCNCYFPATADMDAKCAVCNCGLTYRKCV